MRYISCAFLTLLATVAVGQPTNGDLFCNPNYSRPEGGVEVNIHSNNRYQFRAPQVFFGGVPSPRVTVVDADNVKAVAPAHATGAVDVTVIDDESAGVYVQQTGGDTVVSACGTTCAAGKLCSAGTCSTSCVAGTSLCTDGKCHDLDNDNANCGVCGTVKR